MNWDWQNLIVLAMVAVAAGYVVRLTWTSVLARRQSACGNCRNCGSEDQPRDVFSITSPASGEPRS